MRTFLKVILVLMLCSSYQTSYSQTLEEYVKKAEAYHHAGDLAQATKVMEEAIQRYPDNVMACSYLGLYLGTQAGMTQNYMEAGQLINKSYEMLNKAISIDHQHPIARFHRGLMGIKVPSFFGKLDEGIQDLELLLKIDEQAPKKLPPEMIANAYNFLAEGYQKKQQHAKAIAAWEKVRQLLPGSDSAKNAQKNIDKLTQPKQAALAPQKKYTAEDVATLKQQVAAAPQNSTLLLEMGKACYDTNEFEKAAEYLNKAIQLDSTNIGAYKLLLQTYSRLVEQGYDQRIYSDTDLRSRLAFEIASLADKAVNIAPTDPELRFMRGSIGVMMPFFVGKLEQAMDDLTLISKSDAPEEIKAGALYWLGYAHQKKATTYWIKVVTEYGKTAASGSALASMRPHINHLDPQQHHKPFLAIDFVLGFRDELAPQTAIWIEDKKGNFVKTVYVSGFSGFAKEKQVNLSDWAKASQFRDTDAVTSASIDIGHHIYVWDLTDYQGKLVKTGEYVVKVEVTYWPSMEYELAAANFIVGKQDTRVMAEEGKLIPYLMVQYYSK